jgi:O-antigen/teichoic acid export membrane protein
LRWIASARLVGQLLSWAGTVVVVRLLTPDDYGLIAIGGFFILYLLLLSEGGLSSAPVRQPQLSERMLREAQTIILAINIGCCAILILAAPAIAHYFDEPRLRQVLPVLAFQFLLVAAGVIPNALLARQMRFKEIATINVVQTAVVMATTLALALAGAGVWSLVVSNLVGFALKSALMIQRCGVFHRPVLGIREAGVFGGFSGYVLLDRTLWHVFANIDALIVNKTLGTTATGYYSVAQNLATIPLSKIAGVFGEVSLPAFSSIQDDQTRVRKSLVLASRNMALLAFPIGAGLASVADPLIVTLLGDNWASVSTAFQFLAVAIPFRLMGLFESPVLLAMGRPRALLLNRAVSLTILVAALLIGSRWGLAGVAAAWAAAAPAIWVATTARCCRVFGWQPGEMLRPAIAPLFVSVAMFAIVSSAAAHLREEGYSEIFQLLCIIPLGASIYGIVMWAVARQSLTEMLELARGLLGVRRRP